MSSGTKKFTRTGKKPSGSGGGGDDNPGNFVFNFTCNVAKPFNFDGSSIISTPSGSIAPSGGFGTTGSPSSPSLQSSSDTSLTPSAPPTSKNVFVFGTGTGISTGNSGTSSTATLRRNLTDITPTSSTTENTKDMRRVHSDPNKSTTSSFKFETGTSLTSKSASLQNTSAFDSTPTSSKPIDRTPSLTTMSTPIFSFGTTSKSVSTSSSPSFGGESVLTTQPITTTITPPTPSVTPAAFTSISTHTSTAGTTGFTFGARATSQKTKTTTPPTTLTTPAFSFKAPMPSTGSSTTAAPAPPLLGSLFGDKSTSAPTTTPSSSSIPSFSTNPTIASTPAVSRQGPNIYSFSTVLNNMEKAANQPPSQFKATLITPSLNALRQNRMVTHTNFRIDNILPTTRHSELPEQAKKELDELDRYIHGESQRCDHMMNYAVPKRNEATKAVKHQLEVMYYKLDSLSSRLHMQMNAVEELFDSLKHQIRHFNNGQWVIEACKHSGGGGSAHILRPFYYCCSDDDDYFVNLSTQLTKRLEEYKNRIQEIQFTTDSWIKNKVQSPQDIVHVMESQNQTFLALTNEVAALHEALQMEKDLFTQYRLQSITL